MFEHPPLFLQPLLWSYDIAKIDVARDKNIIIKNILDYGSSDATTWLKEHYSADEIRFVITTTPQSDWSKKSLALWSLVYGVSPHTLMRTVS